MTKRPDKWAQPLTKIGLPNLWRLTGALYRGARPEKAGYMSLQELGIKTVIDLEILSDEQRYCKQNGLIWAPISMKEWHPEQEDFIIALQYIKDLPSPIFVHCRYGSDRTGAVCAAYRMAFQDWTNAEAVDEMVNGGYGWHWIWFLLKRYIATVNVPLLMAAHVESKDDLNEQARVQQHRL
jgi:protein tyrosine phosphatase (PTP) superfamily phosphohydrolase (DUF442 family)